MTSEIGFIAIVVVLAGTLLVSGKVRLDIVALLVVLALVLGGALTAREAFAGFGDPVVIMVAGLLVISEMLANTGIAHHLGNWLARHGRGGEVRLMLLVSLAVAILGCFMSNTAVVAIFIPVVLSVSNTTQLNASRLLLPLAYAGLVSGMLTLIAATPNLVVSAELERAGYDPFGFFAFTPIGIAVLSVFVVYMLLIGRHSLPGERLAAPKTPARTVRDLLQDFELMGTAYRMQVTAESPLVKETLANSDIGSSYDLRVIILERDSRLGTRIVPSPAPEIEIQADDVLVVHGTSEAATQMASDHDLRRLEVTDTERTRWAKEVGIAKVLLHPESSLIGSTLRSIGLRSAYGVQVLAVRRHNAPLEGFLDKRLESGDAMLVVGPWKRIRQLQSALHDFVVLALPAEIEHIAPAQQRAPVALAILLIMVALSALEIVPVVVAVLIASMLAIGTGCLTMERAYSTIHWSTLVLIAGMMSIASAATKSGAIDLVVEQLVSAVGGSGPYVMMSALFALTAGLSMVLSNTATAVLLAPIAIRAASALEVSPYAFAMTVAIAASAGFVTPISSPAVMLVVDPGKYRLADFVKVGVPMLILTWLVTITMIPFLFPLDS